MPRFRVDFHHHCHGDPIDTLWYSAKELVDEASHHGIQALAITYHGRVFEDDAVVDYARSKGILLIPGIEKMVGGREMLILNVKPSEIPPRCSFDDLRRLRGIRGGDLLTIAPHPFYPLPTCMGSLLDQQRDVVDAVEFAHLHLEGWNPNERLLEWARRNQCPVVANSDTHFLGMLGKNWSEVEAEELTVRSIFDAIRAGRVRVHAHRPSLWEVGQFALRVAAWQDFLRAIHPGIRRRVRQNDQVDLWN